MKQYFRRLGDRVDAMSLRERVMVFVVAALLLITLVNTLLLNPLWTKQKKLSQQTLEQQGKIAQIQSQIQGLVQARNNDPDAVNRARQKLLQQQVAQLDAQLQTMQIGLVQPDRMALLLGDMLKRNSKLQLVGLKTLPVAKTSNVGDKPAVQALTSKTQIAQDEVYKHGVEITVRGAYTDLYDYLIQLEQLPWHMFWGKLNVNAQDYPEITMTITVYTLSLDRTWLSV